MLFRFLNLEVKNLKSILYDDVLMNISAFIVSDNILFIILTPNHVITTIISYQIVLQKHDTMPLAYMQYALWGIYCRRIVFLWKHEYRTWFNSKQSILIIPRSSPRLHHTTSITFILHICEISYFVFLYKRKVEVSRQASISFIGFCILHIQSSGMVCICGYRKTYCKNEYWRRISMRNIYMN